MRKAVIAVTFAGLASSIVVTHSRDAAAQTPVVHSITPDGKGMVGCGLLGAEAVALIEAGAGVRARWAYAVFPLLGAAGGAVGGYLLENAANSSSPPDSTLTAVAVATLVVGLGLIVPTTVAYVSATSYHPENATVSDDNAPANAPLEESTSASGATSAGAATGAVSGGVPGTGVGTEPSPPSSAPAGTGASPTPAPAPGGGGGAHGPTSATPHRSSGRALAFGGPTARSAVLPGLLNVGAAGVSLGMPAVGVSNGYSLTEMRQYGLAPMSEVRVPVLSGTF